MVRSVFKKSLPHVFAVVTFLIVSLIYCHPVLTGKVILQHDITHWEGAVEQSIEYSKTHDGKYPLWTNALFSGMPTFPIAYSSNNFIPGIVHNILTLGLPKPAQFFFLASICFYFLALAFRVRPIVGIFGALAFSFATYNAVIIVVGHETKMWSIAYMPAVLAGVILIFDRKYWTGAILTTLFASAMISMNHPQITYYLLIVIGILSIFFAIRCIRNKEWKHLLLAGIIAIGSGALGVLTNAVNLFSTYEYQKYTIRGGASPLVDTTDGYKQKGLDIDYALSYSMNITEPLVMFVPGMYGDRSDDIVMHEDRSKAIENIRTMPAGVRDLFFKKYSFLFGQTSDQELYARTYWGGVGAVSGPVYVGAVIIFLAIIAMFVLDNKYKWWIFSTIALSIFLSWGHYFLDLNALVYKYFPFYNKFRAPSVILVIPQLLLPILAMLGLNKIVTTTNLKPLLPLIKKGVIATGALFVLLFLLYLFFDFTAAEDKEVLREISQSNDPQVFSVARSFFEALKQDRGSLMLHDILRSFGFVLATVILLALLIRNTIKPVTLAVLVTIISFIDLITIDINYLSPGKYHEKEQGKLVFAKTQEDEKILLDTTFFRVYNIAPSTAGGNRFSENITSYYYNSVGGYSAAKLLLYQDLIEHQLSKGNEAVLDMLNAKYLIFKNEDGQTQSSQLRPTALGPAWFVNNITFVTNAAEEMQALDSLLPKETAIVQENFRSLIPFQPQPDTSATIKLIHNDNDVISYTSSASTGQFAVFSEIFYSAGWKALIDGKQIPIVKVNYVLRGLPVPAGKHNIQFRFEPGSYYTGQKITTLSSFAFIFLMLIGIIFEIKKNKLKLYNHVQSIR